jgi:hypothetical protein
MAQTLEELEVRRDRLKTELARIGDMRPGSFALRFRKCGKSTCHCARSESKGHGPTGFLTREVKGKTITKVIPTGAQAERVQAQVEEYQRFRALTRELVELSERICEYQFLHSDADEGKKNRTRSRARGRRRPRS